MAPNYSEFNDTKICIILLKYVCYPSTVELIDICAM